MNENNLDAPKQLKPGSAFFLIFMIVFTIVFCGCMIRLLYKVDAYAALAIVQAKWREADVRQAQLEGKNLTSVLEKTESGIIQSEVVLNKAIWDLDLNVKWGNKYFSGETLKTWETAAILKGRTDVVLGNKINVHQLPQTSLLGIAAYGESSDEAALLANSVARAYVSFCSTNLLSPLVQIVDSAYPRRVPENKTKASDIIYAILLASLIASVAGIIFAAIVWNINRKEAKRSA
jgi:capsular polysaccharide biosynthesis protein